MKTTLNKIRDKTPCERGWYKLLEYLEKRKADDEPPSVITILESNGLNDAFWCLQAVENHDREIRLFGVWCLRQVQHLITDQKIVNYLDLVEKYANGLATLAELENIIHGTCRIYSAFAAWEDAADAARYSVNHAIRADNSACRIDAHNIAQNAQAEELRRVCAGSAQQLMLVLIRTPTNGKSQPDSSVHNTYIETQTGE